jgi:uncharacterized membrane protein YjdF
MSGYIRKHEIPILAVNCALIVLFGALSVARLNYEFVIYIAVIAVFLIVILAVQREVEFSPLVLWGLTAWAFLHMAGGNIRVGEGRLYEVILLPLMPRHCILRYDHFVHTFGFAVATLVGYHLLRRHLKPAPGAWVALSIVIPLIGMGLGALNEVVELLVVLAAPESGVGGYFNTAFDLLFNTVGAALATVFIHVRRIASGEALPRV